MSAMPDHRRMETLRTMPARDRFKIRAQCQRVLDDSEWQAKVIAESAKLGHSKDDVVQQARNIIAFIDQI